jgi:hypothetical protein
MPHTFTAPLSKPTLPPAITRFSKRSVHICQHGRLPIIVSQPSLAMENLFFADPQSPQSVKLDPYSDEDIPLECIARGPLCAYNNDGVPTCGDPAVSVRGTGRSDDIWVEWSDPRPPKPDVKPPKSDVKPTMPIRQRRGSAVAKWEYFDSTAWQQV